MESSKDILIFPRVLSRARVVYGLRLLRRFTHIQGSGTQHREPLHECVQLRGKHIQDPSSKDSYSCIIRRVRTYRCVFTVLSGDSIGRTLLVNERKGLIVLLITEMIEIMWH